MSRPLCPDHAEPLSVTCNRCGDFACPHCSKEGTCRRCFELLHEPVTVKAYGIFEMTRRGYLRIQIPILVVGVLLTLLLFSWSPPSSLPNTSQVWPIVKWGLAIACVAELIELAVMLRKFDEKEKARRGS